MISSIDEFIRKFQGCSWRADWNNYPHEVDGFYIVTEDPNSFETVQVAYCDTKLTADVVCYAMNRLTGRLET